MNKFIFIAIGGACGSLMRYWVSGLGHKLFGTGFPFGTFAVNMLGCLFFGIVWAALEPRLGAAAELRIFLLVGFMGAFTTYSTYMFESAQLLRDGQFLLAGANIGGQTILGLVLLLLGMAIGKML